MLPEAVFRRVLLEIVSRSVLSEVGGWFAELSCCRGDEGVFDACRILAAVTLLEGME